MKKLILSILLGVVLGSLLVRYEAIQFGRKAYGLGCTDAALKLELLGDLAEAETIRGFCKARDKMLTEQLGIF